MDTVITQIRSELPKCSNFIKCGCTATSFRARFCDQCFKIRASESGAQSSGNRSSRGVLGNRGGTGNRGNCKKGISKERAGKRSGVKRSSKVGIIVKKEWLDQIFAGEKDWEIRSTRTSRRGWIHFAESKAGGKLIGLARRIDCFEIFRSDFINGCNHHRNSRSSDVSYKRMCP